MVFENSPENIDTVDVDIMEVIPNARNNGLEKRLLFFIKELLPEKKRITMATQIWNTRELALYKEFGCVEYATDGHNVFLNMFSKNKFGGVLACVTQKKLLVMFNQ